jgi:type VI protein secretion system component VasK
LFLAFGLTVTSYWVKERALLMIAVIAWFAMGIYAFTQLATGSSYDAYWAVGAIGAAMALMCTFGWTRMKKEEVQEWDEMMDDPEMDEDDERRSQDRQKWQGRRTSRKPQY